MKSKLTKQEEAHIHTLSKEKTKFRAILDVMINQRHMIDRRSMTAKCSECGVMICAPTALAQYYKVLLLFAYTLPKVVGVVAYDNLFAGADEALNLFLSLAVAFIVALLEIFVIPTIIMALCAWETVNTYNCTEEKAREYAQENWKEKISGMWGYAFLGLFLSILVRLYLKNL